ncbi:MAG TPA: hypothetical protein ENN76_01455 [Euryarchaeota archaeon]|nr:hypothetical protein [Euryarchaeota archaeon]
MKRGLLIFGILVLAALLLPASDSAVADQPFYVIHGRILMPNGTPVPDGVEYTARNLDRDNDNFMFNHTYSSDVAEGIYKVTLHDESMPQSFNSMSYNRGDRIKIMCTFQGNTVSTIHTVPLDPEASSNVRIDMKLEPIGDGTLVQDDEPWYKNPYRVGAMVLACILVAGIAFYLFVPPKES